MYLQLKELGEQLLQSNINQAYLCFEQAAFLCHEPQMKKMLQDLCQMLEKTGQISVNKTAFVIVSYNQKYLMEKCIESIRQYCNPDTYSVVVFDNGSDDGVAEWLGQQNDILLLKNATNVGFPIGCNVGAQYAPANHDIYLLNNDTRMAENALFWLRMGLYSSERVGATGGIANYAGNHQDVEVSFSLPSEYQEWGKQNNVIMDFPFVRQVRLSGFSMLIKRNVWDLLGGMDEDFSPGYFEDDDLSIRICLAGYELLLCKNSFIYHAGSQSFSKCEGVNELLLDHYKLFVDKHGFYIMQLAEANINADIWTDIDQVNCKVIEFGCGLGKNIFELSHKYPNLEIYGIEPRTAFEKIVENEACLFMNVESFFDRLRLTDTWEAGQEMYLIINEAYMSLNGLDDLLKDELSKAKEMLSKYCPNYHEIIIGQ